MYVGGGPCHLSASDSVLGPSRPLRTAGLLTDGKNRYFCVNIVNINILSLTSLSRTPQWASHSSTWSVCQGLEADSESVLVRMSSAFYRTRNNQMCAGWCVYWNTVCWIHFSGLVDVQHELFISCTWTDISVGEWNDCWAVCVTWCETWVCFCQDVCVQLWLHILSASSSLVCIIYLIYSNITFVFDHMFLSNNPRYIS